MSVPQLSDYQYNNSSLSARLYSEPSVFCDARDHQRDIFVNDAARRKTGLSSDGLSLQDCEQLSDSVGEGACRIVFLSVCQREAAGEETTVWDIHRVTELPLHEAFAALRTLEYGRIVDIRDNPSDPFGATIRLRDDGLRRLRDQTAA